MNRAALVAFFSLTLAAGVAVASERSERLYTRGLVDFGKQRYAEALQVFEQAVQADPRDPYTLYYRGVTHGRLGDFAAAASDLKAALTLQPELPQAPLELGVALVQSAQYAEAVPWLEKAQAVADLDGQASLFLGIAQLRLDQIPAARANFIRAAARDPGLEVSARYYQGVADYRDGKFPAARDHFAYVNTASPGSDIGRQASLFLSTLGKGQRRPYELFASVGFQYDSNVVLAPSNNAINSALAISKQADGRITFDAGGTYTPWRNEQVAFTVGYEFYQSLQFSLNRFNLEDHRPSAQIAVNAGPVQLGLLGHYDYYFLQVDSFLQEGTVLPWATIPEPNIGRTEVWYRMRRQDFLKRPYSGVLDSFNHSPAIRQVFYLGQPDRYASLGYRFEAQESINASGDQYAYDGNEVNASLGWALPASVAAELDYAYNHEQYPEASALPAGTARRQDDVHEIIVVATRPLNQYLRVSVGYFGTLNYSNKQAYDYNRHIGSVGLEVRF